MKVVIKNNIATNKLGNEFYIIGTLTKTGDIETFSNKVTDGEAEVKIIDFEKLIGVKMKIEISGFVKFTKQLPSGKYAGQISEKNNKGEYNNFEILSDIDLTKLENKLCKANGGYLSSDVYKEKVKIKLWIREIEVISKEQNQKIEVQNTDEEVPF